MNSTAIHAANLSPAPIPFWKTEVECAKDLQAEIDRLRESAEQVSDLLTGACNSLENSDALADLFADVDTLRANLGDKSFNEIRETLAALGTDIETAQAARDKSNVEFVNEIDKADQLLQAMQYE